MIKLTLSNSWDADTALIELYDAEWQKRGFERSP